jgi:hypothetical protein
MQENFVFARHIRIGSGMVRLESDASHSTNAEETLEIYLDRNAEPAGWLH